MTLRTLNYGNYGIFLIMGNAGFRPSTVCDYMVSDLGLSDYGDLNPKDMLSCVRHTQAFWISGFWGLQLW